MGLDPQQNLLHFAIQPPDHLAVIFIIHHPVHAWLEFQAVYSRFK